MITDYTELFDSPLEFTTSAKPRKKLAKFDKPVIAVDGEGENDDKGRHRYTLLQSSMAPSHYIRNNNPLGITLIEAIDFFMTLPKDRLIVIFAGSYDFNMMIKGLSRKQKAKLHAEKTLRLMRGRYRISIVAGRWYDVSRLENQGTKPRWNTRRIYDQFGFYQQSFVSALKSWKVGDSTIWARIQGMKERRSDFANLTFDQIQAYCFEECQLLTQLTHSLIESIKGADLRPTMLYGAGCLGGAMLKKYGIKDYNAEAPEWATNFIRMAYFGGRSEISAFGKWDAGYAYDINSAYPYAMSKCRCLAHATYVQSADYDRNNDHSIYKVQWDIPSNDSRAQYYPPFPVRCKDNSIAYPLRGTGCYFQREVEQAIRFYGECIQILDGMHLISECEHTPFDWLPSVYQHRKELKNAGNAAQLSLKLGINALYGKTAQTIGFNGNTPPYHNLLWAGYITSHCRAQLYDAIMQSPEQVLSVATDGIVTLSPLSLVTGDNLGDWEFNDLRDIWIFQPGVYWYEKLDSGTWKDNYKTRGFSRLELSPQMLKDNLMAGMPPLWYNRTRFITLGASVSRIADVHAEWLTYRTKFSPIPRHRMPDLQWIDQEVAKEYRGPVRLYPSNVHFDSQPYQPHKEWNAKESERQKLMLLDLEQV